MGNAIRRHGDNPPGDFTLIRNDLIVRSGLTPAESVVLLVLLSHRDGWEVTQESLAHDAGITRPTVKSALAGLVAKRKLVVGPGKRGHCEYHINPSRDFTADEATLLAKNFTLARKESSQSLVKNPYHKQDYNNTNNNTTAAVVSDVTSGSDSPSDASSGDEDLNNHEDTRQPNRSPSTTGMDEEVIRLPNGIRVIDYYLPDEEDVRRESVRQLEEMVRNAS